MILLLLTLLAPASQPETNLRENAVAWGNYVKCLYGSLHTTAVAGVPENAFERQGFVEQRLQDCFSLRAGAVQSLINVAIATGQTGELVEPAYAERKIRLIDEAFIANVVEPEKVRQRRDEFMKCLKTKGVEAC